MARVARVFVAALIGVALAAAPTGALAAPPTSAVAPMQRALACTIEDATLTWGFKESFRAYISGTIANGEWTVSDGATYETPHFGFSGGSGTYGEAERVVSFAGAIRFTGHGGILDTTVANPRLDLGGGSGSGTLYLDVSGTTQEGEPVDESAVPFARLVFDDGVAEGDVLRFEDVAATLTDEGAATFGTYEAGETLDPLTVELELNPECAFLPSQRTSPTWPIWIAGALGAAIVAVVAVLVVRRRREIASPD